MHKGKIKLLKINVNVITKGGAGNESVNIEWTVKEATCMHARRRTEYNAEVCR